MFIDKIVFEIPFFIWILLLNLAHFSLFQFKLKLPSVFCKPLKTSKFFTTHWHIIKTCQNNVITSHHSLARTWFNYSAQIPPPTCSTRRRDGSTSDHHLLLRVSFKSLKSFCFLAEPPSPPSMILRLESNFYKLNWKFLNYTSKSTSASSFVRSPSRMVLLTMAEWQLPLGNFVVVTSEKLLRDVNHTLQFPPPSRKVSFRWWSHYVTYLIVMLEKRDSSKWQSVESSFRNKFSSFLWSKFNRVGPISWMDLQSWWQSLN